MPLLTRYPLAPVIGYATAEGDCQNLSLATGVIQMTPELVRRS